VQQQSLDESTQLPGNPDSTKVEATGKAEQWFAELLAHDPQFHNPGLSRRIFADGSVGIGEGYMEEWWTCEAVDELASRLMRNKFTTKLVTATICLK